LLAVVVLLLPVVVVVAVVLQATSGLRHGEHLLLEELAAVGLLGAETGVGDGRIASGLHQANRDSRRHLCCCEKGS